MEPEISHRCVVSSPWLEEHWEGLVPLILFFQGCCLLGLSQKSCGKCLCISCIKKNNKTQLWEIFFMISKNLVIHSENSRLVKSLFLFVNHCPFFFLFLRTNGECPMAAGSSELHLMFQMPFYSVSRSCYKIL